MAKKNSKKRIWIILSIILLSLIGLSFYLFNKDKGIIKVNVDNIQKRTISQTVSAVGKIMAETEVKVSSQSSGEIIFLGAKEGDTVRKNQLLARIKPDIIEEQLKQMRASVNTARLEITAREAEMNRAQSELNRTNDLFKKDFASKKELEAVQLAYDQAVAGYKSSQSRYEQSLAMLQQTQREQERTIIFSPIAGVITSLPIELGEKVVGTGMMAGTELMRVSDLSIMNAEVEVDENDIAMVSIGDTTNIEVDALSFQKYKGVVIEIGHSAISSAQGTQDQVVNFKVKVRILDKEPKLRPGMSCNVEIITETRSNVLSAPLQAITVRDENINRTPDLTMEEDQNNTKPKTKMSDKPQSIVFIYSKGVAVLRKVETGISDNGFIEILSGLNENEKIISGPFMAVSKQIENGAKVVIDSSFNKNNIKK